MRPLADRASDRPTDPHVVLVNGDGHHLIWPAGTAVPPGCFIVSRPQSHTACFLQIARVFDPGLD